MTVINSHFVELNLGSELTTYLAIKAASVKVGRERVFRQLFEILCTRVKARCGFSLAREPRPCADVLTIPQQVVIPITS